jgi:hypothetical protein
MRRDGASLGKVRKRLRRKTLRQETTRRRFLLDYGMPNSVSPDHAVWRRCVENADDAKCATSRDRNEWRVGDAYFVHVNNLSSRLPQTPPGKRINARLFMRTYCDQG